MGFSPVCFLSWSFRFPAWLKVLLHFLHSKGFSPVCILSCDFRLPAWLKALLHCLHLNGFSPVCILSCLFKFLASLKALSQCLHSNVTNSRGPGISLANTSKKIDKKHFLFVQFPPIKCIYQAKVKLKWQPCKNLTLFYISKTFENCIWCPRTIMAQHAYQKNHNSTRPT